MADDRAPQNIDEALLDLQLMNLTVKKTAEGAVRAGKTDKYADLAEFNRIVLTALNSLGVIWTCMPTLKDAEFVLSYSLIHVPSGTSRQGDFPIQRGDPQKMGSAITYGRRYALGAVTGVAAEGDDDDGQGHPVGRRGGGETAQRLERSERARIEQASTNTARRRQATEEESTMQPRNPDEPVTGPQQQKLIMQFKDLGISDREERLSLVSGLLARPIGSIRDLSKGEAHELITSLDAVVTSADPQATLAELIKVSAVLESGVDQ